MLSVKNNFSNHVKNLSKKSPSIFRWNGWGETEGTKEKGFFSFRLQFDGKGREGCDLPAVERETFFA
jgi:hypothetical protein